MFSRLFRRFYAKTHFWFQAGIFIKFLNGLLEIIGGLFLLFVQPETMRRIIRMMTFHELSEDPNDLVANYLMRVAGNFSIHAKIFGTIFLLSHGLIKIFLVVSLWKRRLWAYPVAIIVFGLFAIYQIYQYAVGHAIELVVLTVADIFIIILTWVEYKRLKLQVKTSGSTLEM
ncbi:conserved membrane hypothetical protein [Candidatus Zixiibacteriota bacterium]|nr:conserved membrane hypothetical protein [candidate division Zixibacteria bacterium]